MRHCPRTLLVATALITLCNAFSTVPTRVSMVASFFKMPTKSTPNKLPALVIPENFAVPEPKPLQVTSVDQLPKLLMGGLALALRLGVGITTEGWSPKFGEPAEGEYALKVGGVSLKDESAALANLNRPKKPLVLYEYEASPFCRIVREACSKLDLIVDIKPTPQGATTTRAELLKEGGKVQVPFLMDENTGMKMYESLDIVEYLYSTYGPGKDAIPFLLKKPFAIDGSILVTLLLGYGGGKRAENAAKENALRKPLELYAYEGSPFVRPVREALSELELPHKLVFSARGSQHRNDLVKRTGRFQVPFLSDPNTGVELFEGKQIAEYLRAVYTVKDSSS